MVLVTPCQNKCCILSKKDYNSRQMSTSPHVFPKLKEGLAMFKTIWPKGSLSLLIALGFCLSVFVFQAWAQGPNAVSSRSSMKNENGLQRLLFAFPEGRLVINLPDDIRPGDTISGTVA